MGMLAFLKPAYKFMALALLAYAFVVGLGRDLPDMGGNMAQTSRNVFYHVPMWFCLYSMMAISVVASVMFLRKANPYYDILAAESAKNGMMFGLFGLTTGIVWSRVTWRELIPSDDFAAWWSWDPKLTMVIIAIMIYLAYFILRSGIDDTTQKARISAVYNIFAAATLVPLTYLIPMLLGGLHPGGDAGNPLENVSLSNEFRAVFYPAALGFILLSVWILELRVRYLLLHLKSNDDAI
jgi:heme exporter protein C